MNSERVFEWQLGNWLGLSPVLCWLLLAFLAVGGVALAAYFYRHTLRALTARQRMIFVLLRAGFFLSLLLCLAGPSRVERVIDNSQEARPLAVLVDRSASMTTPDSRQQTRLATALKVWKKAEPDATHAFPSLRFFRFTTSSHTANDLDDAVNGAESGTETHLFNSLTEVLKSAPSGGYGGIVCLTDGLDTSEATTDETISQSLQNHSPLYFCVGQGKSSPHETLLVRELDVPGQVLRRSQFSTRVVVEAHSSRDRDVPLSLLADNKPVADTKIHLHAGANLIPWTVPLDSAEAGLIHLECRLGEGDEKESIAAAVRVVASEQIHILFYQGSLDWSYRFINHSVQSDASFSMTGLFSQGVGITREVATTTKDPVFTEMPSKATDLQPFQIVVLSNVFADQMSLAQQTALTDYVHGGGGVLFLVSDSKMASTFTGTTLEGMMPVIFEAGGKADTRAEAEAAFQEQMRMTSGADYNDETSFSNGAEGRNGTNGLKSFSFPSMPKRSEIADLFGAASGGTIKNVPKFATYARVHGIKAGADILAIHPDDKTAANTPRALLVTQRYGQGNVTALLTDGLWRWKLSLPSNNHDPEIFWQQLFRALCKQQSSHGNLRFGQQPFTAAKDQVSDFRLDGASGPKAPDITAISPGGVTQTLTPRSDGDSWTFQLKATEPGKWRIHAEDSRGAQMETWLRVSDSSHGQELSGLPADTDGLRNLAAATGGSLLDDGVPGGWSQARAPAISTIVSKHTEPLWDNWILLLIGLGFYVTELIWRRTAKLL